mgnify:FL=1
MISIIIPIYNSEKYIKRCVSSVIDQSYDKLEILLVDDGSTDNSLNICEAFAAKDNRIKVISQNNGGVSKARNTGLRLVKGEYVMFLDSDDYMLPDMCKTMLDVLHSKQADCVICGIQEPEDGLWCPQRNIDYSTLEDFKRDFIYQLNTELLSPCWNKIFKKQLITNLFNEEISFGEDLIFDLEYLNNCSRLSFITTPLVYHEKQVAGSLVTKTGLQRLMDIENIHQVIMQFAGEENISQDLHKKYIRDLTVYARFLLLDKRITFSDKKRILKKWILRAYLNYMPLMNIKTCLSNRLLLLFLKYRCWALANILVNR